MKKEELMQYFGPKLIDAILQVFLEELNIVRTRQGMAEKTEVEIINKISKMLDKDDEKHIKDYEWMNSEKPKWVKKGVQNGDN